MGGLEVFVRVSNITEQPLNCMSLQGNVIDMKDSRSPANRQNHQELDIYNFILYAQINIEI